MISRDQSHAIVDAAELERGDLAPEVRGDVARAPRAGAVPQQAPGGRSAHADGAERSRQRLGRERHPLDRRKASAFPVDRHLHPVRGHPHQVGAAGAGGVDEHDLVGTRAEVAQARGVRHPDRRAEAPVAQVGPVLHAARTHPNDVRGAVAGQVGEVHVGIGEVHVGRARQRLRPTRFGVALPCHRCPAAAVERVQPTVAVDVRQAHPAGRPRRLRAPAHRHELSESGAALVPVEPAHRGDAQAGVEVGGAGGLEIEEVQALAGEPGDHRRLADGPRRAPDAIPPIGPVRVPVLHHLQNAGQWEVVQRHQRDVRVGQRRWVVLLHPTHGRGRGRGVVEADGLPRHVRVRPVGGEGHRCQQRREAARLLDVGQLPGAQVQRQVVPEQLDRHAPAREHSHPAGASVPAHIRAGRVREDQAVHGVADLQQVGGALLVLVAVRRDRAPGVDGALQQPSKMAIGVVRVGLAAVRREAELVPVAVGLGDHPPVPAPRVPGERRLPDPGELTAGDGHDLVPAVPEALDDRVPEVQPPLDGPQWQLPAESKRPLTRAVRVLQLQPGRLPARPHRQIDGDGVGALARVQVQRERLTQGPAARRRDGAGFQLRSWTWPSSGTGRCTRGTRQRPRCRRATRRGCRRGRG